MDGFLQKRTFLEREGDAWFFRNKTKLDSGDVRDPVQGVLSRIAMEPRALLEIGCSNGWRVNALSDHFSAKGYGVDPSRKAISEGRALYPQLNLFEGTADSLPFSNGQFDLVIYGFCLYLCDRADIFRIAAEGDRVLSDGGHLVIYDFFVNKPYSRIYHHDPKLLSYKMDYSALFLCYPAYTLQYIESFNVGGGPPVKEDDTVAVIVLKKMAEGAYPLLRDAENIEK
jgi:SAM-dependent methyltransferase